MFSVITNIYNKKTKGPTLMELYTATGKLTFFFATRGFRNVHRGWHGTHQYDIQVVATQLDTHAATTLHYLYQCIFNDYLYKSVNFSQAQYTLPEDGPSGPKHVGANIRFLL